MGDTTIEWTRNADGSQGKTWNPTSGCSKVSQGCKNCYAERVFPRPYPGRKFTDVRTHEDRLMQPLSWRKPQRVFVNSMSDLFHDDIPTTFIDRVWTVMLLSPQHTYMVLTKRPERMQAYLSDPNLYERVLRVADHEIRPKRPELGNVGISNPSTQPARWIMVGVSVEDQETADYRIPLLLQTPAAIRFLSCEPLLGPIDLTSVEWPGKGGHRVDALRRGYWNREGVLAMGPCDDLGAPRGGFTNHSDMERIDWVIVGSESGPKARPSDIEWVRAIRDQCTGASVPFFWKQHVVGGKKISLPQLDGKSWAEFPV